MAIARRPPSRQSQIASTGMAKSSKQSLQRQQRTWVVGIMLLMVTDERHTCTTSRTLTWEATIRITTAHRERRWMTLSDIASTLTFSTTDLGEAIFSSVVPVREDKSEVDVELYGEACEDEDLERMRCGRASHTLRALYYNPGSCRLHVPMSWVPKTESFKVSEQYLRVNEWSLSLQSNYSSHPDSKRRSAHAFTSSQ